MGNQYQEIAPNETGWRWSEELGLYLGVEQGQLRYFTPEGDRVPTPEEAAQQAQVQAQQAQVQAQQAQSQLEQAQVQAQQAQSQLEQERQRAERLAEQLRSLGIDPE
jgi:multidrug efflux pump subunit AcrA (membrane-fusion protein)